MSAEHNRSVANEKAKLPADGATYASLTPWSQFSSEAAWVQPTHLPEAPNFPGSHTKSTLRLWARDRIQGVKDLALRFDTLNCRFRVILQFDSEFPMCL